MSSYGNTSSATLSMSRANLEEGNPLRWHRINQRKRPVQNTIKLPYPYLPIIFAQRLFSQGFLHSTVRLLNLAAYWRLGCRATHELNDVDSLHSGTMLAISLLSLLPVSTLAIELDPTSYDSVKNATKELLPGVMTYYDGNKYGGTVGVMSPPYYWWQAASAFAGILNYQKVTGDTEYNDVLVESLKVQGGEHWDLLPENQTMVEANDDQGYWAMFALEAAQRDLEGADPDKPWIDLAKNVFDQMVTRWDPQCGGGLRWQIFDWNKGYDYKNSVSTLSFFNIAARLAHYTWNQTYVDWAYKINEWMIDSGYMVEPRDGRVFRIYDGAGTETNCTDISKGEWSYNYGMYMSGCAFLHDLLQDNGGETWKDNFEMAWTRSKQIFFPRNKTMTEPSCMPFDTCNNDQRSFRSSLARFLGHAMILFPDFDDEILEYMQASAKAAAQSCSGGTDGITCGEDWTHDGWDGVYGLGEEINSFETILNTQITVLPPFTSNPESEERPVEQDALELLGINADFSSTSSSAAPTSTSQESSTSEETTTTSEETTSSVESTTEDSSTSTTSEESTTSSTSEEPSASATSEEPSTSATSEEPSTSSTSEDSVASSTVISSPGATTSAGRSPSSSVQETATSVVNIGENLAPKFYNTPGIILLAALCIF